MSNITVMKFGGTSLGNADRIRSVAGIVAETKSREGGEVVVVVSAMSQVTNTLVSAATHASNKNLDGLNKDLVKLQNLHSTTIKGLRLSDTDANHLLEIIEKHLAHLRKLLESILELGELSVRAHDLIVSFGERMSIHLVTAALANVKIAATPVEASDIIVTSNHFGNAVPNLELSSIRAKLLILPLLEEGRVPVVTGFIGATSEGIITTLGRGGSDYSATIIGYCLDAASVEIWTDVDGVMTADPRIVANPLTIDALSYNEAAELSYFGAKVLHPLTMVPAVRKNTPIWIRNTFNPSHPGTKISDEAVATDSGGKAISTIRNVSLITVQGRGMLGVPGIAGKVFGAVAATKINVLFISQASSEFNISFVVPGVDGNKAVRLLQEAFRLELMDNTIETIRSQDHLAICAIVGQRQKGSYDIAGKIFSSLGEAEVSIIAITQGSSELNISLVISDSDVELAVRSIHDTFHLATA